MAAAFAAAFLIGLNSAVFEHGTVGQAYGMCLFTTVAAFRVAVAAKRREGAWLPALTGFLAGVAAASSLLSAAVLPVLLVWIALGKRWKRVAAFLAGALVPFLPTLWLFAQAPRQTWFNLFAYQLHYRGADWTDATQHDFEVFISWLDSGHALLLILLAVGGLLVVRAGTEWREGVRSEFYLCAWLALAIGAEVSSTHPTFPRYYLLVVPFASILAATGYYGLGTRAGGSVRPLWPTLAFGLLIAFGCAKMLYDRRDVYVWRDIEQVARKVREVTPAQSPLWADENIYFLTRHTPPSGMEFGYSHAIAGLNPQLAAQLHVLSQAEVKRLVETGAYATVETCDLDTDFIDSLELPKLYRQTAELHDCGVYWDRARP
jgi:4-amino-4-deoxy-L-arabinose transferase-like glycosyltransferase